MQTNIETPETIVRSPGRKIVFKEHLAERHFLVENEEQLAKACLNILNERYHNPAWGYKPAYGQELSEDEIEFIEFYETEGQYLPSLLKRHAERIYNQLNTTQNNPTGSVIQWEWYESVTQLLSMPVERAINYKVAYKGKLVPSAYHLLAQRAYFPGEGLMFIGTTLDTSNSTAR